MSDLYAVGDLQGCLASLQELMEQLPCDAKLVFVGDLVNRGPQSLDTLRFVKMLSEEGRAQTVLGNHDLHLLAVCAGAGNVHRRDTIGEILAAPDRDALIDWLRTQPLLIEQDETIFVHAGIPPQWTIENARALAREAQESLSGNNWKEYLAGMYGEYDDRVKDPSAADRMRMILDGFTRMRFIKPDGALDFSVKTGIESAPSGYRPWFELPRLVQKPICFGHWSMAGLIVRDNLLGIDSGCLWGKTLTAVRIADRRFYSVQCPEWSAPGC